jgi:hypothetical protein
LPLPLVPVNHKPCIVLTPGGAPIALVTRCWCASRRRGQVCRW